MSTYDKILAVLTSLGAVSGCSSSAEPTPASAFPDAVAIDSGAPTTTTIPAATAPPSGASAVDRIVEDASAAPTGSERPSEQEAAIADRPVAQPAVTPPPRVTATPVGTPTRSSGKGSGAQMACGEGKCG